jgi:hypothetical protein
LQADPQSMARYTRMDGYLNEWATGAIRPPERA